MSSKVTRKILSIILVAVTAIGGCLFFATQLVHATVCSEKYLTRYFSSKEITAQCNENFKTQIEALEAKSAIPSRVFDAVYNFSEITDDTAVHRLFGGHDTSLYNDATIERFEMLCLEYLDGTGKEYDKALVHNTALEAARIYSDSFGIKNIEQMRSFINQESRDYNKVTSLSLMIMLLPVALIFALFSKPYDIMLRIISAFTATGLTVMITGAVSLIAGFGQSPLISPEPYTQAAISAVRGMFVICVLAGSVIFIGSLIANVVMTDKIKNTPSNLT